MEIRPTMCAECPFNGRRRALPASIIDIINRRLQGGEQWVCHQTCDGPKVVDDSKICKGFASGLKVGGGSS